MLIKYPYTWEKVSGNDPVNKTTNELTAVALDWVAQLKGIKKSEIKTGINALSNREEKRFPPNAMEFRELCIGSDNEKVLDEVLCRLQQGDSFEWQNQLAFNFWNRYSFDLLHGDKNEIPKLIKQNLKMIDKSSMFPLPDYTQKAIETAKPTETDQEQRRTKQRFFATMTYVLIEAGKVYPKKYETLMNANRGWEIVQDYLNKGFSLPEKKEKKSISSMFGEIDYKFRQSMKDFLTQSGVLS
jgi:hypothetical protein